MNDIKNDINLRQAVNRHEQQLPPMPEGLNEKVIKSLEEHDCLKKKTPLHHGRGWRWVSLVAAACLVGFVVIFLAPPKSTEEQLPLALEEPMTNEQQPVVKEEPVKVEAQTRVETPSEKPNKAPRRKRVVPQEPIEEPMLAEAEAVEEAPTEEVQPINPEMKDPFLAIAEQMQDIRSRGEQVRQEVAQLIDKQVNLQ
ncbi:MAG: hypothetical protein IKO73_00745 [Bacteroidaceae bacterium]|nr:hypothetical protein [Bacteroidaceae bacterium]